MKNKLHFLVLGILLIALSLIPKEQAYSLQAGSRSMDCDYLETANGFQLTCFDKLTATPTASQVPTATHTRTPLSPTVTSVPPSATHAVPSSPTASQTAIPQIPTNTRTATPQIPVNTSTPSPSGSVSPFASAPLCPTHNDTAYHSLWDSTRGCHYDHTHGDNPALADGIFGIAGRDWGQNISYPFMTANENNAVGHTGYKYYVNLAPQPACARESFEYLGNVNCVSAFRIQYHDVGGSAHMVKRFHSYYLEAQVKKGNIVGYIRTGGWADFGCLHGSYKDFFIVLPGIDPTNSTGQSVCGNEQDLNEDPYRNASTVAESLQSARFNSDNFWSWTSTTASVYGYNKLGGFFYRVLDASGGMDAADPSKEYPICPDFKCKYNNSEQHVYTVMIIIPASLDTDRDGIVNYTGYTDRKGNIVQGCTSPSLDCVPLQIVNAPVGQALWARNLSGPRPAGDPVRDYDIYFNGQPSGWIQFPVMP